MKLQFLALFVLTSLVSAHGGEQPLDPWQSLGVPDPLQILLYASLIAGAGILYSLVFEKKLKQRDKKIAFAIIAVPVAIATLYLASTTVYLNMVSESGGPVHWHADYEVWACGEKHELIDPTGLENRVGSATVHEHNDNRMHIEGVLFKLSEAELGHYFKQIGGEYTGGQLGLPTHDGYKVWRNGDKCNGREGQWLLFVNGEMNSEGSEHIIAPYSLVPPGDRLKFIFTEKPAGQVNGNLGEQP